MPSKLFNKSSTINCKPNHNKLSYTVDSVSKMQEDTAILGLAEDVDQEICSVKIEEAEWLTTVQAANFLQMPVGTLRNLTSNGKIPYYKLGRSNRYRRDELRNLLLSNRRGARHGS